MAVLKAVPTFLVLVGLMLAYSYVQGDRDYFKLRVDCLFRMLNGNNDTTISEDDYFAIVQTMADKGLVDPETKIYLDQFVARGNWLIFAFDINETCSPVTLDEMVDSFIARRNLTRFRQQASEFLSNVYYTFNGDPSNWDYLTADEFSAFFMARGKTDEDVRIAFNSIDGALDGIRDGKLTIDEYEFVGLDYFVSDDPNGRGALFYGNVPCTN